MKIFLLFMILTLTCVGCGKNKKGSENDVLESQNEIESSIESAIESTFETNCECDVDLTLSFGYATDNADGFGEIIEIN